MSRSMFFQLDCEAFCTFAKVSSHNLMFYDMIWRQCNRFLCSMSKKKRKKEKKGQGNKQKREKEQLKFNHEKHRQNLALQTPITILFL